MKADVLVTEISQLVTPSGPGPKHGAAMGRVAIVEQAALAISDGRIAWAGRQCDWQGEARLTVNTGGRAVVPGLVDPHTHAVWAGHRLDDFDARTSGVSYEAMLAAGGGIWSTIRSTAAASRSDLVSLAKPRIRSLLRSGATTVEVKSGYGFSPAAEIAMLEAIHELADAGLARIVATLLIHVPPADAAERVDYVEAVRRELIPEVARRKLATAVDIFIEEKAWRCEQADLILTSAQQHGLKIKVHSEQFHSVGGLELGVRLGALSVDHLEACKPGQWETIAASSTIATILPGVSLHLGIPAAPGRQLIDAGAALAVGTDLNPGTSPLYSASAALGLAVRLNGLTAQEALVAGTVNAACALGLTQAGCLEAGFEADFLVLHGSDWRELIFTLGTDPVREVWLHGERLQRPQVKEA